MKKGITTTIVMFSLLLGTAHANINVLWSGLGGFNMPVIEGQGPILDPFPGQVALTQLIFTPDPFISPALPGGDVSGNEVILDFYWNDEDEFGTVQPQNFTTTFSAGFIYARIFEGVNGTPATADPADIIAGQWYYAGPLVATIDNSDPGDPDAYDMSRNLSTSGFGDDLDLQVVPEPSVFALLGIGGLMLALRRRFRK